jgi:hypothetical protein
MTMKKKPVKKVKNKMRISLKEERKIIDEILADSKPKEYVAPVSIEQVVIADIPTNQRMIVECTDKIKNYLMHGWWIVDNPVEVEFEPGIFKRIIKKELVVLEHLPVEKKDIVSHETISRLERINSITLDEVPFIEPDFMNADF